MAESAEMFAQDLWLGSVVVVRDPFGNKEGRSSSVSAAVSVQDRCE